MLVTMFGEDTAFREFLNPMHNDAIVVIGQNQRIVQHTNALSNPIPVVCSKPLTVDENPVTQDICRVLVGTVRKRKNACLKVCIRYEEGQYVFASCVHRFENNCRGLEGTQLRLG